MLYKRPGSPYWWVRFRIRKREVRQSTGTADREKAERYEQRLRDQAWEQTRLGVVAYTWDDAVERWLAERAAKRSIDRDREAFAVVHKYLSGSPLRLIGRDVISKLRLVVEHDRAPATVVRILSVVRAVLRAAVAWGWIEQAPAVAMPKLEPKPLAALTRAQFETIAAELPPHVEAMARFSVETGQRYSAVANLKWSAVNLERAHAFIDVTNSKSKRAIAVPLNRAAVNVLRGQASRHAVYVFPDHLGRAPIRSVKTAWLAAVKRAGLQGVRWHDLRHTWASWHTANGTPPIALKELGGWSSLAMVERYSHLAADHLAQWAESGTKAGTAASKKARKRGKNSS